MSGTFAAMHRGEEKREMESFGSLIARERRAHDYSQEELAEIYSSRFQPLTAETLNEIEQDRLDPRSLQGILSGLATLLEIDLDDLRTFADDFPSAVRHREALERSISSSVLAFRRSHLRR